MRKHLLHAVIRSSAWLDEYRKRELARELLAKRASGENVGAASVSAPSDEP